MPIHTSSPGRMGPVSNRSRRANGWDIVLSALAVRLPGAFPGVGRSPLGPTRSYCPSRALRRSVEGTEPENSCSNHSDQQEGGDHRSMARVRVPFELSRDLNKGGSVVCDRVTAEVE